MLTLVLKSVRASGFKGGLGTVDIRPAAWDSIGGLEAVKQQLRRAIEWPLLYPDAFQRMNIKPSNGCLLYGPPGMLTVLANCASLSDFFFQVVARPSWSAQPPPPPVPSSCQPPQPPSSLPTLATLRRQWLTCSTGPGRHHQPCSSLTKSVMV